MGSKWMIKSNLKEAMKGLKKVIVNYKGTNRVIEPYLTGINFKGNEVLRAYQVSGYSSSGDLPAWRLFLIADINNVDVLEEYFEINDQYNPNDKAMKAILFRVER